jgi:hypothetical protein
MATTINCTASVESSLTIRERVRYFPRQLLTADDMRAEQEYFREKQRRHNRLLHGWGVICGMEVSPPQTGDPDWQLTICPGAVLTPQGDEIVCSDKVAFDVKTGLQKPDPCVVRRPCPPAAAPPAPAGSTKVYLAIRYVECSSRPVRVQVAGCACDESACEYSRVRDSFELSLLPTLPASHQQMKDFYNTWCVSWKAWKKVQGIFPLPVPPCPACPPDPWVVLATVNLPTPAPSRIDDTMIVFDDRIPLYSSTALQVLNTCK